MVTKWLKRIKSVHYAAILLNPRSKFSSVLTEEKKADAKRFVNKLLTDLNVGEESANMDEDEDEEDDFYRSNANASSDALKPMNEFENYLLEPVVKIKTAGDLMDYWREKAKNSPKLAKVARAILSIPASERSFSDAGLIINIRRTSIKSENVDKMLFVRSFLKIPIFDDIAIDDDELEF